MARDTFSTILFNIKRKETFSMISIGYVWRETTHSSAVNTSLSREATLWSTLSRRGEEDGLRGAFQTSESPSLLDQTVDGRALIPEGCRQAFRAFLPWDNPRNVISARTADLTQATVYCGLLPLLSLLGIFTNFLSCAVFYRLGTKRGINLCLLLLSLSDQMFLLSKTPTGMAKVVLENLYGSDGDRRWQLAMVTYHIVRKPVIFISFSNFLTMLASLDRCTSVVSPLKARLIFTHKIIVTAIATAFVVTVSCNVFIGFKFKNQCVYNTQEKSIVWGIGASDLYKKNKAIFDFVDNIVLVFVFPLLSIFVVTVSTSIIVHKLKKASRWRQTSVRADAGSGSSKSAETQLNKMLIVVSIIHVVCTLPSITKDVVKLVNPDFSLFGRYGNLFLATLAWKDAAAGINCTVNFFVYRTLSSQFRHTLSAMLMRRPVNTSTDASTSNAATTSVALSTPSTSAFVSS